jgi:parvulin-like peptidyl-prolyl isomerase
VKGIPVLAAGAAVITIAAVIGSYLLSEEPVAASSSPALDPGQAAAVARVDSSVLTPEQFSLFSSGDPDAAGRWVEDELLAQLARSEGLDNELESGFVSRRSVQLLLRDRLLERELAGSHAPAEYEVLALMESDSLLYLVERHYFEILVADSALAESLRARISAGQNFQILAGNLSLGQKAALGGDLGFVTGGELTGRGLPADIGTLAGLSRIVRSDLGWHIFLVTEVRPLADTARVVASLSEVLQRRNEQGVIDSLLNTARARFEVSEP